MRYIGLTGNIASGKSAVAKMFAEHGATIIDADVLAREVVEPGSDALREIQEHWGSGVLTADGRLDRAALRRIVFEDQAALEALNAIIHPRVGMLRDARLAEARARGDAVVVYVVPLLFEAGLASEFDDIVLVDAPLEVRIDRIVRHRRVALDEARRMAAAQMPAELKRDRADLVIENAGSLSELHRDVDVAWAQLTAPQPPSSLAD